MCNCFHICTCCVVGYCFHQKILQQLLVCVSGVSAAERDDVKSVKEGESVTLHPGVINNTNDLMTWYYNDVCITGDQSQTCTDGSLTIRNIRTTD